MPNRIIREGIIDSEAVNALSPEAEVFYRRLMSVVDDFGRFDGRIAVLRARLYALQLDKVREASLERWIAECVKARLIRLYEHDRKPYVLFLKLGAPRAKASKYPDPPQESGCEFSCQEDEQCAQTQADARTCAQTQEDVPYSYSNSYSSSGTNTKGGVPPPGTSSRFKPPTTEEVAEYIREKAYNVSPQAFVDYYTANGWKVGRHAMKDWRAAVRTWQSRQQSPAPSTPTNGHAPPVSRKSAELAALLERAKQEEQRHG